jgi:hypothetical protein
MLLLSSHDIFVLVSLPIPSSCLPDSLDHDVSSLSVDHDDAASSIDVLSMLLML